MCQQEDLISILHVGESCVLNLDACEELRLVDDNEVHLEKDQTRLH